MAILFSDDSYRSAQLFALAQKHMPNVDLRLYPQIGDPDEIDYAVIWRPKPGSLQHLPRLKAIFTTSAGVDAIVMDDTLPDVPIVRNVDPHLTEGVTNYVVYHALRYHRHFHIFEQQQRKHEWLQHKQVKAQDRVIGIMGMGEMGSSAAQALLQLGFVVRGWSRTKKDLPSVQSFYGDDQLNDFLSGTDILVNLLPLTDATRGLLNSKLFAQLPRGAFLINAGRGAHMVESDVLAALDSGQLAAASLDVFDPEPLPADNPLWAHPNVTVTPHIASLTDYQSLCRNILHHIQQFEAGQPLPHLVDKTRQY